MLTTPATRQPWEQRLDWLLSVLLWTAFGIGLFLSVVPGGRPQAAMIAGSAVGVYVVAMQVIPRSIRHGENIGEFLAVSGVLISLFAVALTDGLGSRTCCCWPRRPSSPEPTSATASASRPPCSPRPAGGRRGDARPTILQGQLLQTVLLYLLIAVTFAQARRVLVEERAAAAELHKVRVERLEAAHSALVSLQELADAAELNPVTVGRAALRDLALLVPYESGQVVLDDEEGPIVVARRGEPGDPGLRVEFSMDVGSKHLGGGLRPTSAMLPRVRSPKRRTGSRATSPPTAPPCSSTSTSAGRREPLWSPISQPSSARRCAMPRCTQARGRSGSRDTSTADEGSLSIVDDGSGFDIEGFQARPFWYHRTRRKNWSEPRSRFRPGRREHRQRELGTELSYAS